MQIRKLSVPGLRTPLQNVWLTPREQQVLRLVARARAPKAIATELHLSIYTVRGYIAHMLATLELSNRGELILWALRYPGAWREGCAIVAIAEGEKDEECDIPCFALPSLKEVADCVVSSQGPVS